MKQMLSRRGDLALLFVFFASFVGWIYIGVYYTLYSIGVYLIVPVLLTGAVTAGLSFILPGRSGIRALRVGLATSSLLYILLIGSELNQRYQPTYKLIIPENYEGRVLMFFQEDQTEDVMVDENGIGYIQRGGGFDLELYHGDREITEAFNSSRSHSLTWYNADSTEATTIDSWCFDVDSGKEYSETEQPFLIDVCLTTEEFEELVENGTIDSTRINTYHQCL